MNKTPFEVAGSSDIGTVRQENQDRWAAFRGTDGTHVLLLADGMGGHVGGGDAAEAAVAAVEAVLRGAATIGEPELIRAVEAANAAVAAVSERIRSLTGTTLVAGLVTGSGVVIANVGDSRAYLAAAEAVTQLTRDHTWIAEQVEAGQIEAAVARRDPRRNALTRAVTGEAVMADITRHPALEPGQTLALCSDGVWEPLDDTRLGTIWASDDSLDEVVRRTCGEAIEAGSRDNVTVVAIRAAAHPGD